MHTADDKTLTLSASDWGLEMTKLKHKEPKMSALGCYIVSNLLILCSSQANVFWKIKLPEPMIYFGCGTRSWNSIVVCNGKSNDSTPIISSYSL